MNKMNPYNKFLEQKRHISIDHGINPTFIPDHLFDYQKHIIEKSVKRGRCAGFIDTGLGKTIIELVIAQNYLINTNKPVLIITPLAVAFQFIKEAEKFGINDVFYSKNGQYKSKIVICNYERLHYFNPSDFDCVILDESSILKNFDGETKQKITAFLKQVKYRFLFTATPSPNDYIELGTSSEALGYLGYMDMLGKFFKNNHNTSKISRIAEANAGAEWYLKPHAEVDFWQWVNSWSISARKPSDIGFSDTGHQLPALVENMIIVRNQSDILINGQLQIFNIQAQNFREIKKEVRDTIQQRCERATTQSANKDISVYWCNLNEESALLAALDKNAVEIKGAMDIDKKEEILLAFSEGKIRKIITKPSITAFGLNWQHCNHTVFFPTYSYEQYYQSIRRFWRFGQKNTVEVDLILSDGQTKIMNALIAKKDKAINMFENLIKHANSSYDVTMKDFNKNIKLPSFLEM